MVTGYGEDLARTAFSFEEGMVETLAHFRAARAFDPQVSFILDIGGQDMKAIFVRNGHIQNSEINEACCSGCGSFIESFSRSVGYTVSDFAQKACTSKAPCDLGTRCTVFMNSKVKQALREGAEVSDISAGLAYSVIKNAIHKVLKIRDTSVLGDHIVVQGGTFRNPAVHKAMERLLGKRVLCPDIAELMGAYGAALTARDTYVNAGRAESRFVGLEKLEAVGNYERRTIHCRGCENKCAVTKLIFHGKNAFYTGNRCEKVFTNSGTKVSKGTNLPAIKVQLLFDRETDPTSAPLLTLGIPRALNLYENFPFWNTLFVECGFRVHLSDPSSNALYARGAGTVMSENICFPAKLAHGHIINLVEAGVDRIFYPLVAYEEDEFTDALNCYNCPIIWGYPDVVRSAIDPAGKFGIPLDRPAINFRDKKLLKKACRQYLAGLGVSGRTFNRAFVQAIDAQKKFKQEVRAVCADILHQARADGRSVVLLLGRPYHLDPLINHKVPEILSNFGIDVITEDAIPLALHPALDDKYVLAQWEYSNRFYHAAHWAGQRDSVEVVQLNSFGCGPDAVVVDEIRDILGQYGKNHTVIRVDEIESTGSTKLRLRSMIESLKENEASGQRMHIPRKMTKVYQKTDRHRTVLAPQFSHFCTLPLARPLMDLGFKVEILPPANRETVEVGLKYVNNEICYPAIILIGDLIKALQSGKYDPSQVAVGITQSGGACRATSYLSLVRRALVSAGFQDIPVVTLSISAQELNEQPGFKFNTNLYIYKAIMSIVYADALSTMYHATAIRELRRGEALEVANRYLAALGSGALRLTRASILETLARAVGDFNRIKTKDRHYPTVGLVGEIFVKYNSFSNHRVVQWLMDREIEVIVPPMIEFFASWIVNAHVGVRSYLKRPDLSWLLSFAIDKHMQAFLNDTEHVMAEFRYHRPHHTIQDIAREAQDVLSLTNQFGESWLIAGEIGTLVKDGVQNVLCMQPFGCIANHVVAKGVGKRLKQKYPRLNLLFLDTDAGTSEVNLVNRLHFFINHARRVGSYGK
jgi:predicted nucleotide-binding protein (sugar kinase/HSP70/actin superfamily)